MKRQTGRRRLLDVARSLSIDCKTAQEYLESRGISGYEPDSLIPRPAVDILVERFGSQTSVREKLLQGVRRALGRVSRVEKRIRELAVLLRGQESPETESRHARDRLGTSPVDAYRTSDRADDAERAPVPRPHLSQGRIAETDPRRKGEPTKEERPEEPSAFPPEYEAEQDLSLLAGIGGAAGRDRQEPSEEKEDREEILEQLETLESLLARMSKGTGWSGDDEKESLDSFPEDDVSDEGLPDGEEQSAEVWTQFFERSLEGEDSDDPFTLLEKDIEDKAREEFLDESLRELEALLSELGSEDVSEDTAREPVPDELPEMEEGYVAAEAEPPESEISEEGVEEVPGADVPAEELEPAPVEADQAVPEEEPEWVEATEEEPVAAEAASQEEGDEAESLVSELLDLSALLQEIPEFESEEFAAEPEPPDQAKAAEQRPAAASVQAARGRESLRKWFRRSIVPYVRSVSASVRSAFRELAPAQRRVLAGFGVVMGLAVLAGLGWHLWSHRPRGDIALWHSGQELLSASRPEEARREFSRLVQRYPDSHYLRRAMYLLGECLYREGSYEPALDTFLRVRKLLASRPREIDGLLYPDFTFRDQGELRIADCYVRVGRFEEGISIYETMMARDEHAPAARKAALARAEGFLAWGDREGSPSAYRRAAQAFTLYREQYRDHADRAFLHWKTALAYLGLSKTDRENARDHLVEAAVELERARDREPELERWDAGTRGELTLDLATTYFRLSQWPEAIAEYDKLLGMDPSSGITVRAKLGRAQALFESGEYVSAFEAASEAAREANMPELRAEALFARGDAAWELRRYDEMLVAYEEALSIDGGESLARTYAERAHMRITNVLFVQDREFEEAADRYRRIVSRYPDGPYTHLALYRLGCSLFELERYEEAASAYRRSIHDYPQFEHRDPDLLVDAYYRTAECYMLMKSWPEAIAALKAALQDLGYPEDERGLQARVDLAACYAEFSLYDRAIEILENYLERFPDGDTEGRISMRLADFHRGRFDFAAAREIHRRVAEEHKGEPIAVEALFGEGKDLLAEASLAAAGEKEALRSAALLRFEKALQVQPENPAPALEIARIYHGEGDFSAAKVYLGRYFELNPEGPEVGDARFLAGETAYSLGAYREAVEHFERLDPSGLADAVIAQASYEQGYSYRELGDLERAEALFRETARLFPSSEWGKEARWQLDHLAWQERLAERPVH